MRRRPMCVLGLLFTVLLWILHGMGIPVISGNPLPETIQQYIEEHPESTISGELISVKESDSGQIVYLRNTYLIFRSETYPIQNVQIHTSENCEARPGSLLVVSGKLLEIESAGNPGEFDFKEYNAARHIYYTMQKGRLMKQSGDYRYIAEKIQWLQNRLQTAIHEGAGEAEGIFTALVLGDKGTLSEDIKLRYQMTGIIHILAVSGMHISLLGMGIFRLMKKIGCPIWFSGGTSIFVVLFYALLCGSGTSAIRALTMFLLSMGAVMLGRIYDLPTALSISALLILLESPAYLLNSSFLLSFGAVTGAGIAAPEMIRIFQIKSKIPGTLITSLAVLVFTMPIQLYISGEVSFMGLLLNLAVLPTAPVLLFSAMTGAAAGLVSTKLSIFLFLPGRILCRCYDMLTRMFSRFTILVWTPGSPAVWRIMVFYGLVLSAVVSVIYGIRSEKITKKRGIGLLGSSLLLGFVILGSRYTHGFSVTFLDVGQGDCAVIQTETGENFLIDCGSSNKNQTAQYQLLPFLKYEGIRRLDAIFVSHTDNDHISGIAEYLELSKEHLTTVRADRLILPRLSEVSDAWIELFQLASRQNMEIETVSSGDVFLAGTEKSPISIRILSPDMDADGQDVNRDSVVLLIEYEGRKGLFAGDITEETERWLLENDLLTDVDYLKVAHHGSKYSSSEDFLEVIVPEIAVISCSDTNLYGHPAAETVKRLENIGAQVEYTMKSGAVTLGMKADGWKVEGFKDMDIGKR